MDQNSKQLQDMEIIMYSRKLAKETSIEAAIVYGALLALRMEKMDAGEFVTIDDEKVFFATTQEEIASETALTIRRIRPAITKLVEIGALEKKRIGLPSTNYYHIVPDRLFEFYEVKGGVLQ